MILTSRRAAASGVTGLRVEAVDALSPDEALLLARELPHLQALTGASCRASTATWRGGWRSAC